MKLPSPKNLGPLDLEADGEGSWAISYGDMVTLLLAFFILFFSVDQKEEQQSLLSQSLLTILKTEDDKITPNRQNAKTSGERAPQPKLIENLDAKVTKVGNKIVVDFPGISFFPSGDSHLTTSAQETLQIFAQRYTPFAGQHLLTVVGFTDSRPLSSRKTGARDNLELSALRAVAAQRALQHAGIPLSRMRLAGHGVTIPKLPDGTLDKDDLALARKIVLIIDPEVQDHE